MSETVSPSKQPPARQHFVQDHAERPDVGALVDRLTFRLLGAHVAGGPENDADLRSLPREGRRMGQVGIVAARALVFERFRESVVEHLHCAVFLELDVCGLQVAVDDPRRMACFERLRDLLRDRDGLIDRDRTLLDPLRQCRTFDQFQDQSVLLKAVNARDIRMVQRREELRFSLESRDALFIGGELVRQHLDGYVAVELRVASAIDLAHPTLADRGDDFVGAEVRSNFERHSGD